MNSSLRLMASRGLSPATPHTCPLCLRSVQTLAKARLGRRNEKPGQARKSACPAHSDSRPRRQKVASLRPATMADRPRRSAGRHPHIRAPAARRHRNAPRMPGHSAPPARRRPAPMGCGAPAVGRRGGRGRRSRRRAGVVPCWTRCRAPGSARTRGCRPGLRAGSALPAPGRRHRRAGRRRRFPAGNRVFVSGIVDGAGHGGTSWRLRPCGPCPLGRSPAPTVQSISPSAPPLDCLEPSPAAPVLTGTTPDTTRRRECPARLPINCSNA